MNKIVAGMLFGVVLGAIDGATAWFYPETHSVIGGMIVGLLSGWFARKVESTKWGIVVGAVLGLLFAFLVAAMQKAHYLEIMLPGFVTGAIIGFLTQSTGARPPLKSQG
jgi:F0F1-type ATP synthase assembly protein I